ncbi:MAG: hypothetical protein QM765_06405 [Myxococcales bacterium]
MTGPRNAQLVLAGWLLASTSAWAQEPPAVVMPCCEHEEADASPAVEPEAAEQSDSQGYTPPAGSAPSLALHGYVDIGLAKATGDGTSFRPGDTVIPADYEVDTFAPMVNSRGDVASTDSKGRFTNGFLPRSVGIGGNLSFLVNTVDLDVRYQPPGVPLLVFARAQFLPRFTTSGGDGTRVLLEQAFGRIIPFDSQELALTVGKFDSVFGIEYLDNQANLRTGITPSLMARYTTGTPLGAKLFYRYQFPSLWSAVSLNVSATNSSPFVEALQPPDLSFSGVPVGAARLGYELDLPKVQLKIGLSGMLGPRNDQRDWQVQQRGWGADLRFLVAGLSLAGEWVYVTEDRGEEPEKLTGAGVASFASGFAARGLWAQVAYGFELPSTTFRKLSLYVGYSWRHAKFEGFDAITVDRFTGGVRLDVWDSLSLKLEALFNRELEGAPNVDNDVYAASLVYSY